MKLKRLVLASSALALLATAATLKLTYSTAASTGKVVPPGTVGTLSPRGVPPAPAARAPKPPPTPPKNAGPTGRSITTYPNPAAPSLGASWNFEALGYNYVYHKPDTVVWGDSGAMFGDYDYTTFSPWTDAYATAQWPTYTSATHYGAQVPSTSYGGTGAYEAGMSAAAAAYTSMKGYAVNETLFSELSTYTLQKGVYDFPIDALDTVGGAPPGITAKNRRNAYLTGGTLTLDGETPGGISPSRWVFKVRNNLSVTGPAKVVLINGAQAENVYWQVQVDPGVSGSAQYGEYVYTGVAPYYYTYYFKAGAWIGDDPNYPPFADPAVTGAASFQGNIYCRGDIIIGQGTNINGRCFANLADTTLGYVGWYFYACAIFGSATIYSTDPVNLGSASTFAILAKTTITNTGDTSVKGDLGVSDSTGSVPPIPPLFMDPPGIEYAPGAAAVVAARTAASAAGTDCLSRHYDYDFTSFTGPTGTSDDRSLVGKTLPPGVYIVGPDMFTGTATTPPGGTEPVLPPITLDGRNDPGSVWIFRTTGLIDIGHDTAKLNFVYKRSASPDNIIWCGDTAKIRTGVNFRGTIIATSSSSSAIILEADATLRGRAIALNGGITMDNNTVFSVSNGGQLNYTQVTNPSASMDEAVSVANDGTHMYVFGYVGGTSASWRIEKRKLSDGTLFTGAPAFGTGGVVTQTLGTGANKPRKILVDSAGGAIYLVGSDDSSALGHKAWRIEKRSLSTGALTVGFGTAGVVLTARGGGATDIVRDGSSLYITGEDLVDGEYHLRCEKRSTSTGALDTSFGEGAAGFVTDTSFSGKFISGTAGALTTSTITCAAFIDAGTDTSYLYVGNLIRFTNGLGAGWYAHITAFDHFTGTMTVDADPVAGLVSVGNAFLIGGGAFGSALPGRVTALTSSTITDTLFVGDSGYYDGKYLQVISGPSSGWMTKVISFDSVTGTFTIGSNPITSGVIIGNQFHVTAGTTSGATAIALSPTDVVPGPSMILAGWNMTGSYKTGMMQKRLLSTGALDVLDPVTSYLGFGTDGVKTLFWGLGVSPAGNNEVHSLFIDSTNIYTLERVEKFVNIDSFSQVDSIAGSVITSATDPYESKNLERSKFTNAVVKFTSGALAGMTFPITNYTPYKGEITVTGDISAAVSGDFFDIGIMKHCWMVGKYTLDCDASSVGGNILTQAYLAQIYDVPGTLPYAEGFDFADCQMVQDGPKFFIIGTTTGPYGGAQLHIEKRKLTTLSYDVLFNCDGDVPGLLEQDPSAGTAAIDDRWIDAVTGTPTTTVPPAPTPPPDFPGANPVAGKPDRLWGVTQSGGNVFIVGMDSTDLPSHNGQWRIESRIK